jgi:predicted ribosomally synthesized peptide with SipW-like signal peptide
MSAKKAILAITSLAAVAALSVGGTMAYLSWETESIPNTFTMGEVEIEQLEYERAVDANGDWIESEFTGYGYTADKLQEFSQDKVLLPAVYADGAIKWDDRNGNQNSSGEGSHQQPWSEVGAPGSNQLFDDSVSNVQDKFVFVKNTGTTDAYYRTIIAIECPDGFDASLFHLNCNGNNRFAWSDIGTTTIDGVQYVLKVATYTEVLKPEEVSRPSFLQLFINPEATSEDMALFDGEMDIRVVSQAVQADANLGAAEMLDAAFDEITATSNPWATK